MWAYLALAGVQMIGGFQQADIIRSNGELQTNIDNMNADFAKYDGNKALQAGYSRAAEYQTTVDTTNDAVKAAYAGAGVSIGYGTAGNVTANNTVAGMVNTLQLQRQGQDAAMGYDLQGINLNLQGSLAGYQADIQADSTQAQGVLQGLTTSMGALGQYMSTGKGQSSQSGNQSGASWINSMKSVNMSVAPPSGGDTTPTLYSNGYGWYPDGGSNGSPGFFGTGPRPSYSSDMDESQSRYNAWGNSFSFSSETQ